MQQQLLVAKCRTYLQHKIPRSHCNQCVYLQCMQLANNLLRKGNCRGSRIERRCVLLLGILCCPITILANSFLIHKYPFGITKTVILSDADLWHSIRQVLFSRYCRSYQIEEPSVYMFAVVCVCCCQGEGFLFSCNLDYYITTEFVHKCTKLENIFVGARPNGFLEQSFDARKVLFLVSCYSRTVLMWWDCPCIKPLTLPLKSCVKNHNCCLIVIH